MVTVHHVKGAHDGEFNVAQSAIENALRKACDTAGCGFDSMHYTRTEFTQLLQNAHPNSIIYYDGHGYVEGTIRLSDGLYSSNDIRDNRRNAVVFLHCCYSLQIATGINDTESPEFRDKLAILLARGGGTISDELDEIIPLYNNSKPAFIDHTSYAERVSGSITSVGIDRIAELWNNIIPISIGLFSVPNDHIIFGTVADLVHFHTNLA